MDNVPTKQFRYFSTFSGIGGFELGLQRANMGIPRIEKRQIQGKDEELMPNIGSENGTRGKQYPMCVGYSEIDKYATKVYERHFPNHDNYGDITKINAEELPDFDCLVGGFPCQAFSIAGKRKGFDDTRGTLFFDLARILRAKQPRLFVFENVKGLLSHDNGNTFRTIIATIDELGYDCQWQVLNSKNHGVPQNRERVFIVGHLRGTPRPEVFPITAEPEKDNRTMGQEISYALDANYYKGSNTIEKSRRQVIRHPLKFMNRNQKNIKGDYSFTVDSMNTGGIKDGMKIRRLTPIECERLQGFPDKWTALGINDEPISDSQRYKMCGNAVTTNVIQTIFEKIFV